MNVIKFNTKTELINNWKLIDEKFINEGQLGKLFNFNSIPTIYEELNNKLYLHIKGEVIGNFYSGIDRESIESFNDNEEKGVIVGKAKPLYRIVKNTNGEIEKLRGSTNISIRDLLSVPYNDEEDQYYLVLDIAMTKVQGVDSPYKKIVVHSSQLNNLSLSCNCYSDSELIIRFKNKIYFSKYR